MKRNAMERFISGGVAGLAGTFLIMGMQAAGQKLAPQEMPPIRQHPGEFMVKKFEEIVENVVPEIDQKIPEAVEKATAQLLGVGYGLTFALIYAAIRPKVRNVVLEGSALGLACWATGYLGWLPATKLMPAVTRQKPGQVFGAIASHLAYGVATTAAYRKLQKLV
jgi:hypothetical protein